MKMPLRLGVTPSLAVRFRRIAGLWVGAALAGTVAAASVRWATGGAAAHDWEPTAWIAAVVAVAIAAAAIRVSESAAGAWLGFIAVVGGVSLGFHFGSLAGLLPAVALLPPAVLLVLAWQGSRSPRVVTAYLVLVAVLLGAGGAVAWAAYDMVYGPTHPASRTAIPAASPVVWMWSGAVRADGFTVVAGLREPGSATLAVWQGDERRFVSGASEAGGDIPAARFTVSGLEPGTTYRYEVATSTGAGPIGSLTTFPDGPADVTITFSSCARIGSNGRVFDTIASIGADLYIVTGDLFYGDIGPNDLNSFIDAYVETLTQPAQAALYRSTPIAYMWDDHDYAVDNSDAASPSRPAAMTAYRTLVPHYPLAADDDPIFQAFVLGRVRIVMTDTRSARTEAGVLGPDQTAWLARELQDAAEAGQLVLWVNPDPWITAAEPGADDWGGFPEERRSLAELIEGLDVDLVMLGGDAHMVAIDDGSNNTFSGEAGFAVFHAGALDRRGSLKGGPYSHGAVPGGGQFGVVEIRDDGASFDITLRGLDWEGNTLVGYSLTVGGG